MRPAARVPENYVEGAFSTAPQEITERLPNGGALLCTGD